jgi:hypothetical protein
VTFVAELRRELDRVGIRGARARRIVFELEDHLREDPSAAERLGSARVVAEAFARELRPVLTARAVRAGFGACAVTAVLLFAANWAVGAGGSWPDVAAERGAFVATAGVVVALAAQVAFVAGVLALARSARVPRDAAPAEFRLVRRREEVAVAAAAIAAAAQLAGALALQPLVPGWVAALGIAAGVVSLVVLAGAALRLREARALTPAVGTAAGLRGDVPDALGPLVARPRRFALGVGAAAVIAMTVGSAVAEGSLAEGLTRGTFEAVAFAGCWLALGRTLSLRS